ncbi:hypothetical protein BD770DRAFT_378006 [Pilaira anomala]|nr:hypothetical protein BD770DRAFT_378006 [Pilaira anomala]
MTFLNSFPFFSIFSSQTKPADRIRKSIGPISSVIKRQQPFSTTSHRALPKSSNYYQYKQQETSNKGPEIVTETSILNNFPRPNLLPTLNFSLFGGGSGSNETRRTTTVCNNCTGPHSTDFCPC